LFWIEHSDVKIRNMFCFFLCIQYPKYTLNLNLPVTADRSSQKKNRNTNKAYIYINIHIHIWLCVLCLCVFVFQFNFYVEREAFQLGKLPRVAPPQSICTSRVLRTCYMLHPKYSFLSLAKKYEQCKSWNISSCKLHPSSLTSAHLRR
jgi:hypothetical protein